MTARSTKTIDLMREKLTSLSPRTLEIYDDSHEHADHAGAKESGGGHFQVLLVSERFEGKSQLARHRLVYQALADLMPENIHALAIRAYAPSEFADSTDNG